MSRAVADLHALVGRFGDALTARDDGDEPTALVERGEIVNVARTLRDEMGYQLLRSVTAVDFLPSVPRFQVVYHLTALPAAMVAGDPSPPADDPVRLLRLKVPVAEDDAVVPSIVEIYGTANWHEREVYDLFGIQFAGHPDLRRILLPDPYDGHPLRKDFPLQYEAVAFSHNREAVEHSKPRAKS